MSYTIAILLSTFASSLIYTQEKIPRVESLIIPSQIKETMTYYTSPWNDDGDAIYYFAPDEIKSKKVIRAFHSPLDPNIYKMNWFDNDILDYNTLRPLFKKHPFGTIHYNYEEDGIVGLTFISEYGVVHKEIKTEHHNYVMSGPSVPLLAASLPLKVELKVKFSTIAIGFPYVEQDYEPRIINYLLHVTGTDTIAINNKKHKTFVVEIYPENPKEKGVFYKAWMTQDLPHSKIQSIYTSSDNKDKDNGDKIFTVRKLLHLTEK